MSTLASLPIEAIKTQFCQTLSEYNTVVLSAPPGAGKSTCLPLWLLKLDALSEQKIYLLQPRRLAVKNIAIYLASQLNEAVGETVGYRLRNETKARGELSTERDSSHLARYFMMGAYGLRTYTHMHLQPDTLQQLADQLYQDLCAA